MSSSRHLCALFLAAAFVGCAAADPSDAPPPDEGGGGDPSETPDTPAPVVQETAGGGLDAGGGNLDGGRPDGATDGGATDGGGADAGAGDGGGASGSPLPCGQFGNLAAPSGPLVDLGHATAIVSLQRSDSRVLSVDGTGHWVLWNTATRAMVAQGTNADRLALRPLLVGDRLAVPSASALQIRSASTGAVLVTLSTAMPLANQSLSPFGLSPDGRYAWVATSSRLTVWRADGTVLATANGDYSKARVFAAPDELRIGGGAAGSNVVQKIAIATGVSVNSASFSGTFHSWFSDGARFFTNVSSTVRVYSSAVVQQNIVALPTIENLTGQGDVFWTYRASTPGYPLDIYSLKDTSAPAKSYALRTGDRAIGVANVIGVLHLGEPSLNQIALTERGFPSTTVTLPVPSAGAFTTDASGRWLFGSDSGAVFDGADLVRPLSCGMAHSIAVADTGTVAIATAAGGILTFGLGPSSRQYLGTLPFKSSHVEISTDGTTLAAAANLLNAQYSKDRSLKVFSLPAATTKKVWAYSYDDYPTLFFDFTMSATGNRFGHVTGTGSGQAAYTRKVFDPAQSAPVWSQEVSFNEPVRLSPNGTRVAASTGQMFEASTSTNIYENGSLVSVVPGYPSTWLDADRLLVSRWSANRSPLGSEIYDAQGVRQATPKLPNFGTVSVVSPSLVYVLAENATYSLATGTKTWTGATPACGAGSATNGQAVYVPCNTGYAVVTERR